MSVRAFGPRPFASQVCGDVLLVAWGFYIYIILRRNNLTDLGRAGLRAVDLLPPQQRALVPVVENGWSRRYLKRRVFRESEKIRDGCRRKPIDEI